MHVYDVARTLAKSIAESDELKKYNEVVMFKNDDIILQELLDNFAEKQMILQKKHELGQDINESERILIEEAFKDLSSHENGRKIIDSEIALERMMNEVYKIISAPLANR